MLRTTKRLAAAVCLAALTTPALAAPAPANASAPTQAAPLPDADPALWVVRDADTTVYLFGTFHALDGKTDWFNDEVKAAFDKSGEIVVEAVLPEDPAALGPMITKYAVDPSGKTLRSRLSPELRTKFEQAAAQIGVPVQALDQFEPWMATLTLVAIHAQKLGLNPDQGADMVIKRAAKKAGKPIAELEGAEWQFAMFDRLPEAKQLEYLRMTLEQWPQAEKMLRDMMVAWNGGDDRKLDALTSAGLEGAPDLRKMMLGDRNATWAKWIEKRMQQPGTVFVAVGAGHLAGSDSVQAKLGKDGIKAVRLGPDYARAAGVTAGVR